MVRNKTAHSSPYRREHLQFLFEHRSESLQKTHNDNTSQQLGNEYGRAVRSYVKRKLRTQIWLQLVVTFEPNEVPLEGVEVGCDEDEEEVYRERKNPKNTTSREKQEHEDSGHAVYRNWCAACLICRDSRYGQTGATCCERKGPTAYSISFHVGFTKYLSFSMNHFEMRQRTEHQITSRCSDSRMCGSGSDSTGTTWR